MLKDYHVHTSFSFDSESKPEEMLKSAIRQGMKVICITDHHDLDYVEPGWEIEFDEYLKKLENLREQHIKEIEILIGVEFGLQPHLNEAYEQVAKHYPFDFIIGSTHLIDGYDPWYPEYFNEYSDEEGYRRAFEVTLENVRNIKCFDVLGHLDYLVRYGHRKEEMYSYAKYAEYIDEILKILVQNGKGLEVNTGGFRAGLSFAHPHQDVLKRYRELGGEIITIGSDAHVPEQIGYRFDVIKAYLEACGFKYYTEFCQRTPKFCAL